MSGVGAEGDRGVRAGTGQGTYRTLHWGGEGGTGGTCPGLLLTQGEVVGALILGACGGLR